MCNHPLGHFTPKPHQNQLSITGTNWVVSIEITSDTETAGGGGRGEFPRSPSILAMARAWAWLRYRRLGPIFLRIVVTRGVLADG